MMLLYLEMITSGRTFPNDSVNVRLERLEGIVFGKEQQGDPKQRLAALMTKVSSGASDVSGGTRRLIGGVSKSDVAAPGHNPTDPQNGRGSVKFAASHIKGNRSLEVVFSIGGSRFENSFNGQGQMDALVAQYVKYVAGLLVNPPAGDQLRVNLTMSGPGISGGFSEGSVTARPAPRMVAMPATAMIQSSPPGAAAYGRIATAGFTRTWSGSGTIGAAGFARPSSSSSGSIKTASFSLPSSGGGSTGTASFLQPSPGNGTGGQHLRGGDSSPNDSSPVHFSPLIIQVNAGGSHVSNSFNSESQSTNFLEKAQTGNLDAVPSARPYALSVSIGGSSVSESFDGAGAEQPVRTAIEAFVASKNFETPSDSMPMKRQRPLILNISMGGGRFENSFNKTGGIVRLANKLADGLESSVRPEVLNNLSEIYLGKGGCHITDAYSSK
jgi:hypothetical protein